MRRVVEKVRSIAATSLIGGTIGALLGGVFGSVLTMLSTAGPVLEVVLGSAAAVGGFGALVGTGLATALSLLPRQSSVEELPISRVAPIGFLVGALFPPLAALVTGGVLFPNPAEWITLGALFGILGGSLSSGLVAVAKHESREALLGEAATPSLGPGDVESPGAAS